MGPLANFLLAFWLGGAVSIFGNFVVMDARPGRYGAGEWVAAAVLSLIWPLGLLWMGGRNS